MPDQSRLPLWAGRTAALLGILLVALNLRTAVAALSPIYSIVSADISLSAVSISIIAAAPPLAFAVGGSLAPWLGRRFGLDGALLLFVGTMAIGHLARAISPSAPVLIVATIVTLLGVGGGNVLLPPLVKRYFPDRIRLVTSLYVTLLSVSTAVPALVAVSVAEAVGWRASLGLWFVLAVVAVAPALVLLQQDRARRRDDGASIEPSHALETRVWRSPAARAITLLFISSGMTAYAIFAWLPDILVSVARVSAIEAGNLLSLTAIVSFPIALLVPVVAVKIRNVGILIYISSALSIAGYLGLILAPTPATVLWVVLIGVSNLTFPLSLVLINARTKSHRGSVAVSGFVQGFGYALSAIGPLLVGILHELTGGWVVPIGLLGVIALIAVVAGVLLTRPRFVEDELAARASR